MKKLLTLLLLLAPSVLAQNPTSGGPIPQSTYTTPPVNANPTHGTGAPSGTCMSGVLYTNDSNGNLYSCNAGTWGLAGAAGTVTHTAGNLTAFHLMLGNGLADSTVDSACLTNGTGALSGCTSISAGSGASAAGATATGGFAAVEAAPTGWTPTVGQDYMRADLTAHAFLCSWNGAAEVLCGGAAFPVTVTGGVSGGVPYFSSTTVESASALLATNALMVGGGAGAAPTTGNADCTYVTHTLACGAAGLVDLSAQSGANSFKIPVGAGLTSGANGAIAYDTTAGATHVRSNAADSLATAEAAAIVANTVPKATNSTNSLITASSMIDNGTSVTSTDTGGFIAPVFTSNGTTAGFVDYPQGTTSAAVAPCNTATSICEQAPAAVTSYLVTKPGVSATGITTNNVSAAVITQGISGDANHSATVTTGSGTSVGSTTLCSSTNCPAGTYIVHVYIDITTACGTTGTYVVNLIYTDDQGAKTIPVNLNGTGAVPATGVLTTTSTANFGEASQVLRLTSGNLNYSTTAVACGTAGPMVGKLYMAAVPVM